MKNNYSFKVRSIAFIVAVLFVFSIFIADLFRIQVIERDEYSAQNLYLSSANTKIEAQRGEILDSNGKALVYNVSSNTVYFDASYFPKASNKESRNEIILSLVNLFEKYGVEYNAELPFEMKGDSFVFLENVANDKNKLFSKDYLNLNDYASAQNCFDALCEYYALEEMSTKDAYKVASVHYAMVKADFSKKNPFTFAENVSDELVLILKEQSRFYTGVEIRVDTEREFYDGTIAPHIIGYYDYISAEEYASVTEKYEEALNNENLTEDEIKALNLRAYGMTDKIGKFGIESAMEDQLRGTNGVLTTVTNADGTKTTSVSTAPLNGNNVILTIDADFQKQVQEILAARIDSTKKSESVAAAGSIVVMDVNDFSILACATYPSYDLATYKDNIVKLNTDETAPLWNRALRSTYEPGSTVKPLMGIAGLEEGLITPEAQIKCTVRYTYYPDTPFKCFNVSGHGGDHLNLAQALRYSCNVYFFEIGRQLGINKMNQYFGMFGLGQKTGVEITEATGVVAGPEEREAAGGIWYPGDTVQSAIGQSDNLFTPLQLAAYVSTLANGGTRYKAHFIKSIKSADYSETLFETQPIIVDQLDVSQESFDAVEQGMIAMANTQSAFRSLDYQVASKTGTAEAIKKVNGKNVEITNGFMISYAPAENPQIAVVIAIENITSSGMSAYVRDVYEAYFNRNSDITNSQQSGIVLS